MTTTTHHDADEPGHADAMASGDHHDVDDHGADGGHDDHAHGGEALGPIDVQAWGAGLLGVALGLAMTACFILATAGVRPAA